ncbi:MULTISPECIES: helix-turn-helix domain-containing protein [Deinococcus]|uniref:Helix-turn-helix domain-containing protein n=1 Tax=Deinococcus rufus TaxID=2136097 RepID=A0ABV7Z6E8_9DEIO|nr:helix-turn-helix transcriptional regulator [Deinococcus sp. AB2017081]WQE97137.1 helix-turn-helix transcriptional regulator [Deinococcus sp. AB2017081]
MLHDKKSPSPSRRQFARRLREERLARNLTQEGLGELANLSWNYIGQVERGIRNISVDNMDALAQALGLPLAELLLPIQE